MLKTETARPPMHGVPFYTKVWNGLGRVVVYLALILLALSALFPFVWMLSASVKPLNEIFTYPIHWIPKNWQWGNYADVIRGGFMRFYYNSVKITLLTTIFQVFFSTLAGYAFAKLRFPGRNVLFLLYISTMMIPSQVSIIPQFIIIRKLGLYNNHWALILLGAFSAFTVFFMRQYFVSLPQEIVESARIDGSGEFQTFLGIALPLSMPAIATQFVLIIMGVWNDLLTPLIYLSDPYKVTIPLGLLQFRTEHGEQTQLMMAGSCMALLPIVVIYIAAERFLTEGIMMGAVKG